MPGWKSNQGSREGMGRKRGAKAKAKGKQSRASSTYTTALVGFCCVSARIGHYRAAQNLLKPPR